MLLADGLCCSSYAVKIGGGRAIAGVSCWAIASQRSWRLVMSVKGQIFLRLAFKILRCSG